MKYCLYILLPALFFGCNNSQHSKKHIDDFTPSLIITPTQPQPVVINGKLSLCYELHLTSDWSDTLIITRIEILNPVDSAAIYSFEGDELLSHLQKNNKKSTDFKIVKGDTSTFYIDITLNGNTIPEHLVQKFFCVPAADNPGISAVSLETMLIMGNKKSIVLGRPLSDGPWAAVYDPAWERGHRRMIYAPAGIKRIPGRYAIDFIKLDTGGHYANGNEDIIKNWYGYAADVYAVADGTVASTRDDFTESTTLAAHPRYSSDSATGNYISLKTGDQQFVFYEHLKPGSILVKPGQQVKKGDVIAKLGFTGQTTGPHLHLHIADANSPLDAEGIPFVFDEFTAVGAYNNFNNFGKKVWEANKMPTSIKNERPGPNEVISFFSAKNQ